MLDLAEPMLDAAVMAAGLTASRTEVHEPLFPVPTVEEIRWHALRRASPREDHDSLLQAIALIASILARHGGRAKAHRVERELFHAYGDRSEARRWMTSALGRTGGNIQRSGTDDFAMWEMKAIWTEPERVTPVWSPATPTPNASSRLAAFFEDDDE
jgi:hypothetical protein